MSDVNKQLLEALKDLFDSYKQLADSGDAGNWRIEDYPEGKQAIEAIAAAEQAQAERECGCGWRGPAVDCVRLGEVGPLCPECRETTEQAQQAEPRCACGDSFTSDAMCANCLASTQAVPVVRDVLMALAEEVRLECADAWCARANQEFEVDLTAIVDRYAAQPPAVAGDAAKDAARYRLLRHGRHWSVIDGIGDELRGEALDAAIDAAAPQAVAVPVLRDWPKLLEMARKIIRDGHVHDVGGGDLAVTTCEAFEGLDAFLKKNFPEPLGELTGEERKWLEAEAAIQPPFVPDGYALVPIEPTPEIMAAAAIAAWPRASEGDVNMAKQAAIIVMKSMDAQPGVTLEMLAATLATMAPAYRAMLAASKKDSAVHAAKSMGRPIVWAATGKDAGPC